ncbi:MAG: Lacal_2735 family protein [Bacteroidia bacterium]
MFNLFKKKSEIEKLDIEYKKLLSQAHQMSTTDRAQSDILIAKADEIGKKMDSLRNKTNLHLFI